MKTDMKETTIVVLSTEATQRVSEVVSEGPATRRDHV